MTDRPGLTRKQTKVLGIIEDHIKQHGVAPSYREIASAYGYGMKSLSAVHVAVRVLLRRGYLVCDYNLDGRVLKGSLAVPGETPSVKVLIRPDGTLIRTEESGAVVVKVETVFPELPHG